LHQQRVKTVDLIAISDVYADMHILSDLILMLDPREKENRVTVIAGDIGIKSATENYIHDIYKVFTLLLKVNKYVLYVPGDSDEKQLKVDIPGVINLDGNNCVLKFKDVEVGFLGLGGAPKHSVRADEPLPYLWDENIPMVAAELETELKINMQKLAQNNPDYYILVTHTPPYGVADRSKPITLREIAVLEDLLEELRSEVKPEANGVKKKAPATPRHLGSRIVKDFVRYYKPDIHIFGHVYKEGGKTQTQDATRFFNVSHLSPLPYKLTGRKILKLRITKENVEYSFDHIISERNIPFSEFVERYL
jgi:Icc-related predicted phosphoesterase